MLSLCKFCCFFFDSDFPWHPKHESSNSKWCSIDQAHSFKWCQAHFSQVDEFILDEFLSSSSSRPLFHSPPFKVLTLFDVLHRLSLLFPSSGSHSKSFQKRVWAKLNYHLFTLASSICWIFGPPLTMWTLCTFVLRNLMNSMIDPRRIASFRTLFWQRSMQGDRDVRAFPFWKKLENAARPPTRRGNKGLECKIANRPNLQARFRLSNWKN